MTTQDKITKLLSALPHKLKVEFAIFCANDVKYLMSKESIYCLELTEKWLKDSTSVSKNELRNAAHTANAAAYAAAHAAHAATYTAAAHSANNAAYTAAYSTYNAHAAADAAEAADTANNAAYTAAYSTYNAHDTAEAAYAAKETKIKYYYNHLITMCQNLTDFEKVFYNLEE